jgi:ABC-2 type transport system permease protein
MLALWKKEVMAFFSSLTGYLVAGVFLIITALFLWFIPGNMNIPFGGYATLDALFLIAPWIYLFLVPAITMRLFADELRGGTIELLLTNPITYWQVVVAKYLAGVTLVLISLFPTLLYFLSVHFLAQPVGNIDHGAIWGSYIGLVLLAAVYAAIGLFTSSLTDNQIVAFLMAVVLSYFFYDGFAALASLSGLGAVSGVLVSMGIDNHYQSISRGVIDSRDLFYFAAVIAFFLVLTKTVLGSRRW